MPIARRPSGNVTMALFQPWPLGSAITVFCRAKRVPESPLKTSGNYKSAMLVANRFQVQIQSQRLKPPQRMEHPRSMWERKLTNGQTLTLACWPMLVSRPAPWEPIRSR